MLEDEDRQNEEYDDEVPVDGRDGNEDGEDNFAQDYPLHGRAPMAGKRDGMMEDEDDVGTPQLGYVPKENTMSFGMVG